MRNKRKRRKNGDDSDGDKEKDDDFNKEETTEMMSKTTMTPMTRASTLTTTTKTKTRTTMTTTTRTTRRRSVTSKDEKKKGKKKKNRKRKWKRGGEENEEHENREEGGNDCSADACDIDGRHQKKSPLSPPPSSPSSSHHSWSRLFEDVTSETLRRKFRAKAGGGGEPQPTPVQLRAWSSILRQDGGGRGGVAAGAATKTAAGAGGGLICVSPTGSGKTLAYGVPAAAYAAHRLLLLRDQWQRQRQQQQQRQRQQQRHRPAAAEAVETASTTALEKTTGTARATRTTELMGLVLVPTRELASQVKRDLDAAAFAANRVLSAAMARLRNDARQDGKCRSQDDACVRHLGDNYEDDDDNNDDDVALVVDAVSIHGGRADRVAQRAELLFGSDATVDGVVGRRKEARSTLRGLLVVATPGRLLDLAGREEEKDKQDEVTADTMNTNHNVSHRTRGNENEETRKKKKEKKKRRALSDNSDDEKERTKSKHTTTKTRTRTLSKDDAAQSRAVASLLANAVGHGGMCGDGTPASIMPAAAAPAAIVVIVDEADKMASNADLKRQVDALLRLVSERRSDEREEKRTTNTMTLSAVRTRLLFSATMPRQALDTCLAWATCKRTRGVGSGGVDVAMIRIDGDGHDVILEEQDDDDDDDDEYDTDGRAVGGEDENEEKDEKSEKDENAKAGDGTHDNDDSDDDVHADDNEQKEGKKRNKNDAMPNTDEGIRHERGHGHEPLDTNTLSRIPSNVTQIVHVCAPHKKVRKLLSTLAKIRSDERSGGRRRRGLCIVFFGTVKCLKLVSRLLRKEAAAASAATATGTGTGTGTGTAAAATMTISTSNGQILGKFGELYGQMSQSERERALSDFRCGRVETLLATDVAARGVHVNNVEYVVQYDFPSSLEEYVHRCGRAGRNGTAATAHGFFTRELSTMAPDLVALLASCGTWIDPNLRALADNSIAARGGVSKSSSLSSSSSSSSSSLSPAGESRDRRSGEGEGGGEHAGMATESRSQRRRRNRKLNAASAAAAAAAAEVSASFSMAGDGDDHDEGGGGHDDEGGDDDDDDGEFAALSGRRVVLKRAAHVSDAEESSDEDDDEDDDDDSKL